MLKLYKQPSGAQDVQLISQHPVSWTRMARNVADLLRANDDDDLAAFIESSPFQRWQATNNFGDDFDVLYLPVTPKEYVQLQDELREEPRKYYPIARRLEDIGNYVRFIVADVAFYEEEAYDEDLEPVHVPTLATSSASVALALKDCETLIRENGAPSGLDRIHTAFHGYLKAICEKAGIMPPGKDPDITSLFKVIRTQHTVIVAAIGRNQDVDTVMKQMAVIVNSLNPLRNSNSIAHPNENLLEEQEAMLTINAIRTLLHYLNSRLEE